MTALEVAGLTVRYGGLAAVQDLHLSLEEGTIAVLLGANGAGKTSSLNAICGALQPSSGKISLHGDSIAGWPSHRVARAGLVQVPEGRRIIASMTVEENLQLGAFHVKSGQRQRQLMSEVHDLFPILEEKRDVAGGLLSGGQQQMLALGRALMANPSVMLLDEPSIGLAPIMVTHLMQAVRAIAARGISILMVEQNAVASFEVSSSAYLLERGELILSGPVDKVRRDPLVRRAFLGLEADRAAATHVADSVPDAVAQEIDIHP